MVPLIVLLALVPLASCGGSMDMQQMQMMMQQMMQNQGWSQGWSGNAPQPQQPMPNQQAQNGQWWGMQSKEDHEAYLKWCEEKKMATKEQEQQQELLKMWEHQEEERKAKMERMRLQHEAEGRQEMMMSQWKTWQKRVEEQQEFDVLAYNLMEMKHQYAYAITCEFLKFCKCSDFTEDLERYFMHDGVSVTSREFNLDDLEAIDSADFNVVAQALAQRPKADQVKAFFGGLAGSMCEGAHAYVRQLGEWEKTYNFMERLM